MLQAKPSTGARQSGVLPSRRRLARAGQGAHGSGQCAGQGRSRLHSGDRGSAQLRKIAVAAGARQTGGDARRAGTARAHMPAAALVLDRVLKRLAPKQVVFSALGLREGFLYSQLSRPERYLDPLVEGAQLVGLPLARVPDFAPALATWTAGIFPGRLRATRVCALRSARSPTSPGAITRICAPRRAFTGCCNSHSPASITLNGFSLRQRSMPVTPAGRTRPGSARRTASSRRLCSVARKFSDGRSCWLTVFPAVCQRCSPARACASSPTAFGSKWAPPLTRPIARLSSTV